MKKRITTTLEQFTLEKVARIRRELVGLPHNQDAICRVLDECVAQADEKKVVKAMKDEK